MSMRFEVPQFIEIEDKIFGPFTWQQFVYLAGGVGVGVVSFFILPIFLFALIGLPIAGLGVLLAFYPVNNRPFSAFLESVFRYYNSNRVYHWQKKSDAVYRNAESDRTAPQTSSVNAPVTTGGMSNINSLSRKLELNALQKK